MRGKHEVATDSFGAEGITPAHAGKTFIIYRVPKIK